MTKILNPSIFIKPSFLIEEADKEPHLSAKTLEKLEDLTPKQEKEIEKDKKADYGQECILDISDVPLELFTNKLIDGFATELVEKIGMRAGPKHSWGSVGDEGMYKDHPKKDGLSHIQFLWESSIVIHALDEIQKVFINVFSCKKFDASIVKEFALETFKGNLANETNIVRK
ncbi:MAG: S-adenosylmethionine decarboxylase [Bacteroidota bacterium]